MKLLIKKTSKFLFLLLIVLLASIAFVSYNQFKKYDQAVNSMVHAHIVKDNILFLRSNFKDAEIGQFRYLDTKDTTFLEPIINLKDRNRIIFEKLDSLCAHNKKQKENLKKIRTLSEQQYLFLNYNVNNLKNYGTRKFDTKDFLQNSHNHIFELRQKIDKMLQLEIVALRNRVKNHEEKANSTPIFLLSLFLFAIAILTFYFFRLQKEIKLRVSKEALVKLEQKTRQKVEESEALFKSIFDNSLAAIVIANDQGNYISVNNAASELLEYSIDELLTMNVGNLNSVKDIDVTERYKQYVLKGSENGEFEFITKHGKSKTLKYQSVRIKKDFHLSIMMDISDKKLYQEELLRAKKNALLDKEKAINIANSKQQFLSNMSHEIRTPMNAIIGFTKILLNTNLSQKQDEYLHAIKASGDKLIVLINDILDLAKVDAGKMIFVKDPFKLSESINNMKQLFEITCRDKQLQFINEYDSRIPEILLGDSIRLHQILINLLSNAIKFTSNGQITLAVKMLSEDDKNANLEISVADTGIGIAPNKLETIFNDFEQAEHNTSSFYGGTGLGLAIVKQLVEKQGGKIIVKSVLGEGSIFSFNLNFEKTNIIIKNDDEKQEKKLSHTNNQIKILVAEDVKLNQLLIRTILEDFEFDCEMADNGKIAIEKLTHNHFDIILMDLQMPEMNGFEATQHIRHIMKLQTPIIALTADVTTVDINKCKEAGMNDYISKPFDEKLLYQKITKLLKF